MRTDPATMTCEPCSSNTPPVSTEQTELLMQTLPDWRVREIEGIRVLERRFRLPDFQAAMTLARLIGEIAESENHHPELVISWGRLTARWWTHTISDLHINDFILAARCDELFRRSSPGTVSDAGPARAED